MCLNIGSCAYLYCMISLLHHTLQLLFPEACIHCNAPQKSPLLLCSDCLIELPSKLHPLPKTELVSSIWGLGAYEGPLGSIIRRCKYKPDHRILEEICTRIKHGTFPWSHHHMLTHVPTTKRRLFQRGFDQAQELSQALAKQTGIQHQTLLKRIDPFSQGLRDKHSRHQNLSRRFSCVQSPPDRVLLIDDVRTTGSTLEACAMTLLNEGCREVHAIVLGY